eukprot:Phypoly_transcript_08945.p1 GENE.Phypoly_transcript_08945~~Phypoly_transcript_08945.p1  ORF type:complete len:454 (+),score=96.83 Phypoly_transcript_08945:52-1413(+)
MKVLVIGDSHTDIYKAVRFMCSGVNCVVLRIPGITAQGLIKMEESTLHGGSTVLRFILSNLDAETIIFFIGSVDLDFVYYAKAAQKHALSHAQNSSNTTPPSLSSIPASPSPSPSSSSSSLSSSSSSPSHSSFPSPSPAPDDAVPSIDEILNEFEINITDATTGIEKKENESDTLNNTTNNIDAPNNTNNKTNTNINNSISMENNVLPPTKSTDKVTFTGNLQNNVYVKSSTVEQEIGNQNNTNTNNNNTIHNQQSNQTNTNEQATTNCELPNNSSSMEYLISEEAEYSAQRFFQYLDKHIIPILPPTTKLVLNSLHPPTLNDARNEGRLKNPELMGNLQHSLTGLSFPPLPPHKTRTEAFLKFNQILKSGAEKRGFYFLDVSTPMINAATGVVHSYLIRKSPNDVHIVEEMALPNYITELQKIDGRWSVDAWKRNRLQRITKSIQEHERIQV